MLARSVPDVKEQSRLFINVKLNFGDSDQYSELKGWLVVLQGPPSLGRLVRPNGIMMHRC